MSGEPQRERPRLTLYGRPYCHLCEDMLAELETLRSEHAFEIDVVDVDTVDALERRYGELVPVLAHGETMICHYFLDRGTFAAYLAAFR